MEIDGLTVAEYAYDAFERRVLKAVNGVTTHFHYHLNGLLISETDGNGNPRKDYVCLNGEPVAMKVYGGSAGWYWFVNDHLGTPQKMLDESGDVVWAAAYAPFGEARVYADEITNNLRFPGQYYDVETGLHYNWHRYYDPETGRYLRPDPIGLDGGLNVYAYAFNDPANFYDSNGQSAVRIVGTWVGGDLSTPDPTDAAWPKWIGYGAAMGVAFIADSFILDHFEASGDSCKEKKKGKTFRGGKKKDRDKWGKYQKEKDFQRWWHRKGKPERGGNDLEPEELDGIFQDWVNQGRPKVK